MRKFNIRNPETQNELTEPEEFNLMFQSSIGPTGHIKGCVFFFFPLLSNPNHPGVLIREVTNSGPLRFFFSSFLRPETAQGHFVNFSRLLEFNNGRVPFASAQIGRSFRNEIAPRQGLLRVREFTMAEIEHFVDPDKKTHARFEEVQEVRVMLLPKDVQEEGKTQLKEMSIGDAVAQVRFHLSSFSLIFLSFLDSPVV